MKLFSLMFLFAFTFSLTYGKHEGTKTFSAPREVAAAVDTDSWGYTWSSSTDSGGPTFEWHDSTDGWQDRKSTRLNSSHVSESRMPSSA